MATPAGGRTRPSRRARAPRSGERLIHRASALAALERAADHRVTLVAAPAGSGKTSLLRAWAQRPASGTTVFVQVQRDRHDAQLFWLSVLRAIRQAAGAGADGEPPVATPDFDEAATADQVLAELSGLDGRVTLVIDDAHELRARETLTHLVRVLTNLPEGVHAILATRGEVPQLRLHRLRLAGELAEIREADLRFTEQETGALLGSCGITLSPGALSLLHQRTEGWAAGVRLAAISLSGHPDPESFVTEFTGSDRAVAEYLVPEMLERQPEHVQRLLLRTSVLDRVNSELADLLTGRPGSERILLELEDADAFVVSLDPARTWFRYHHLFADLLRLELRRRMPDEVPGLHRTASGWLAERGRTVEAVRQLQAAGDWRAAAALLSGRAFSLMLDGQEDSMQALLRAFPRRGTDFPDLSIAYAMVDLAHGRLDEARAHAAVAEACLATPPAAQCAHFRMALTAIKLSLARRCGDVADAREHAEFLNAPVGAGSAEEILADGDLRVMALMNLGTAEAFHVNPDGPRHLREGAELARQIGRPYLEIACLGHLGFAAKFTSFPLARKLCADAIALADEHGWGRAWIISTALLTQAFTHVWSGEFGEAQRLLDRAELTLLLDTGPAIRTLLHLVKGMNHAGQGRLREALEEFDAAGQTQTRLAATHALSEFVHGWAEVTRARLGDPAAARARLKALDDPLATAGEVVNALAAIQLAEGDPDGALRTLAGVIDGSVRTVHPATVVEAELLGALAHRELGRHRAAERAVENALTLAEPETIVLPFLMTGAQELVAALPRHETAHAALISDILDVAQAHSPAAPGPTPPLSPTELKVLRYLPTNLSRAEIARALSLSVNTVGTHIRNIYAKLQATDRSTAVRRARELQLLGSGTAR